jgi:hypothetical protein
MKNSILTLLAALFLLVSCNREDMNLAADSELVAANATADFTSEADFTYGTDVAQNNASYDSRLAGPVSMVNCGSIQINNTNPGVFPKVFTVDFGAGCTFNGITRSGILIITLSDYLLNNGSVMTIERNNYYVNGNKIDGTVTYTNQTTNTAIPQWIRTIANGQITFSNGQVFTHSGTRTVRQIEGVTTATLADNVYEIIAGNHTVNRSNGSSLTATIVTPLIRKFSCNYLSQGSLDLQGTYLDGILDYGNNTCDNQATYTHSNGQVFAVSL